MKRTFSSLENWSLALTIVIKTLYTLSIVKNQEKRNSYNVDSIHFRMSFYTVLFKTKLNYKTVQNLQIIYHLVRRLARKNDGFLFGTCLSDHFYFLPGSNICCICYSEINKQNLYRLQEIKIQHLLYINHRCQHHELNIELLIHHDRDCPKWR